MQSNEALLNDAAAGGAIDSESWPRVREYMLSRIDEIISSEFPSPPISLTSTPPTILATQVSIETSATQQSSTSNDKENAPPPPPLLPNSVAIDTFGQPVFSRSPIEVADDLQKDIRASLTTNFPENPPHTIQRVAELVLHPRREYRYLPPYLQALNRALSVTSTTAAFPLPYSSAHAGAGGLAAGLLVNGHQDSNNLGSDESLGGALLTPISWLTAHSPAADEDGELHKTARRLQEQHNLDSPEGNALDGDTAQTNGVEEQAEPPDSSLEARLRAEGAVSQGELLRLEQQAGVTPIPSRPLGGENVSASDADPLVAVSEADQEEVPHARGPEEIGIEDTGPQTGTGGAAGITRSPERKAADLEDEAARSTAEGSTSMDVDGSVDAAKAEES